MRRTAAIKPLVWLVATALLAQSLLVLLATESADADGIVICTAGGFKVISLTNDLRPPLDPAEEPGDHQNLDCTACLVQAVSPALSDSTFSVTPIVWPDYPLDPVACTSSLSSLWWAAHPTRAPPEA